MSNANDFVIERGILKKYTGTDSFVIVPEKVTKIADKAFCDCSTVISVEISSKVKTIGDFAFRNCRKLKEVDFKGEPEKIGLLSFYGCNIQKVSSSEKKAENEVISFCNRIKNGELTSDEAKALYKVSKAKGNVTIKEFTNVYMVSDGEGGYKYTFGGKDNFLVFPSTIDGNKVTKIPCKQIPEGAVIYSDSAFFDKLHRSSRCATAVAMLKNDSLIREETKASITKFIKAYSGDVARVLAGCDDVEAYRKFIKIASPKASALNELLEAVKGNAEITAVLLNSGLEKNETGDELSLEETKKMTVAELKKLWTTQNFIINDEKLFEITNYKGHESHVVVPAFIGKTRVFKISAVFPSDVQSAEFESEDIEIQCSFRNCKSMADENGFIAVNVGCRRVLTDYIGAKNMETLIIPEGITENAYGVFKGIKMRKVVFPKTYKKIVNCSFADCDFLQSVELNEGIEKIGQLAFCGCKILKNIFIPETVTEIGGGAFDSKVEICGKSDSYAKEYAGKYKLAFKQGNAAEAELSENFVIEEGVLMQYFGNDEHIVIPPEVAVIGNMVFKDKEFIKTIIIPEGVKQIEFCAFGGCKQLSEVLLPGSVEKIDDFSFSENTLLKKVVISDGVKTIGDYAFSCCDYLEEVHLPASLTNIGDCAFQQIMKKAELTIYAPAGSYAEAYAKENNIPFVED